MTPRAILAAPLAALLLAGCDSADPESTAEVEFVQQVDGREVVVGRFDAAGGVVDLGDLETATIQVDRGSRSYSASYSSVFDGYRFVFLAVDDGDGSFGLDVSLLASGPYEATPAARRALPGGMETAEVTLFVVPEGGSRPRGQVTLTFYTDAGPDQEVTFDLADHVVRAEPALRVRGADLSLRDDDDGFGFRVETPEDLAGVVPFSVYRAGFRRSTERCSAGGGPISPSWDANTGPGVLTGCSGLDPDTFDYTLFFLKR